MDVYERQITIIVHFFPNVFEKYEISLVQLRFPREGVKKNRRHKAVFSLLPSSGQIIVLHITQWTSQKISIKKLMWVAKGAHGFCSCGSGIFRLTSKHTKEKIKRERIPVLQSKVSFLLEF